MGKTVTLLCGIMTAGKTTFLSKIKNKTTISFDEMLLEGFKTDNYNLAWSKYKRFSIKDKQRLRSILTKRLEGALIDDAVTDIYIDMTNHTVKSRAKWITQIRERAIVKAVYLPISLETAIERNKNRKNKNIPDKVLEHWFKEVEEPLVKEGFAEIIKIDYL